MRWCFSRMRPESIAGNSFSPVFLPTWLLVYGGLWFGGLTCLKHPADVLKRRGKALVDNMRCPRYLNLFFYHSIINQDFQNQNLQNQDIPLVLLHNVDNASHDEVHG